LNIPLESAAASSPWLLCALLLLLAPSSSALAQDAPDARRDGPPADVFDPAEPLESEASPSLPPAGDNPNDPAAVDETPDHAPEGKEDVRDRAPEAAPAQSEAVAGAGFWLTFAGQVAAGTLAIGAARALMLLLSPVFLALNYVPLVGPIVSMIVHILMVGVPPGIALTWVGNGLSKKRGGWLPPTLATLVTMMACSGTNLVAIVALVGGGLTLVVTGFMMALFSAGVSNRSLRQPGEAMLYAGLVMAGIGAVTILPMDIAAGVVASTMGASVYRFSQSEDPDPPSWGIPPMTLAPPTLAPSTLAPARARAMAY
jgi:hypothetical protein